MTALVGLWITVSFLVAVFSSYSASILREVKGPVCNETVIRTDIRQVAREETYTTKKFYFFRSTKTHTRVINETFTTRVPKLTCCSGYVEKNGNCVCGYGWQGDSCSESLYCIIKELVKTMSHNPYQGNSQYETGSPRIFKNRPVCLPQCLEIANHTDFKIIESADRIYHLIPIDSPCNINTKPHWIYFGIGSVSGMIVVLAISFGFVGFLRRKKSIKQNEFNNECVPQLQSRPKWNDMDVKTSDEFPSVFSSESDSMYHPEYEYIDSKTSLKRSSFIVSYGGVPEANCDYMEMKAVR